MPIPKTVCDIRLQIQRYCVPIVFLGVIINSGENKRFKCNGRAAVIIHCRVRFRLFRGVNESIKKFDTCVRTLPYLSVRYVTVSAARLWGRTIGTDLPELFLRRGSQSDEQTQSEYQRTISMTGFRFSCSLLYARFSRDTDVERWPGTVGQQKKPNIQAMAQYTVACELHKPKTVRFLCSSLS